MTLPKCSLLVQVVNPDDTPVAGSKVFVKLDRIDFYQGEIVSPTLVSVEPDSITGLATLDLWPNILGSTGSTYTLTIVFSRTYKATFSGLIIPNVTSITLPELLNQGGPVQTDIWDDLAIWNDSDIWEEGSTSTVWADSGAWNDSLSWIE